MAYDICKICGRMYEKDGKKYYEECFDKNERERGLILDYIEKYPHNNIFDIVKETKVSLKTINRLVADGSISFRG